MADLSMLRRELVIGYVVAGFLAVLVPASVWQAVFVTGHGFWTSLENVIVGPFVAIISFVCSIGNVPLAAALWHGGISFGGVIAFLFADLITLPLLLVYRRYYGTRLTVRLLVVFWALMSAAGLLTETFFRAADIVPTTRTAMVAPDNISWNYTTYLNIAFLMLFATLYWAHRNRARLGSAGRTALDPVCGMHVDPADAAAWAHHEGHVVFFCSDRCAERFVERHASHGIDADARPARGPQSTPLTTTRTQSPKSKESDMDSERMKERIDGMVAKGRITPEEAARLRASEGAAEFDLVVASIRARHAKSHTDRAVAEGRMGHDEADGYLERVRNGEHSPELRKQIRGRT